MNEESQNNNTTNTNSTIDPRSSQYSDSEFSFFEIISILKNSKILVFVITLFFTLVAFSYGSIKAQSYYSSATIQLGEFAGSSVKTHSEIENDLSFYFNGINTNFIGNAGLILSTSNESEEMGKENLKNAIEFLLESTNNLINNKVIIKQSEIDLLKESKQYLSKRLAKINALSKENDSKSLIQSEDAYNDLMMEINDINFNIQMLETKMIYSSTRNSKVYSDITTINQSSSISMLLIIGTLMGFILGCGLAIFRELWVQYSNSKFI